MRNLPFDFDAHFYLDTNLDVRDAGVDPVAHYHEHGRKERRYFAASRLNADVRLVQDLGDFDPSFYQKGVKEQLSDPLRDYLVTGRGAPNAVFNRHFVETYYARSIGPDEHPYVFYCRHRHKLWMLPDAQAAAEERQLVLDSGLFDETFYRESAGSMPKAIDAATHYLVEGFRSFESPSRLLHGRSFAQDNLDLVLVEFNPVVHWVRHGREEGRRLVGVADIAIQEGGRPIDPALDTILLVAHEASRTGAPVVVLSLLRYLANRYNIVVLSQRGGVLADYFRQFAVAYVQPEAGDAFIEAAVARIAAEFAPSAAILNSIVSAYSIGAYVGHDIPVVTLVHDFATYVRPLERVAQALALSDEVVFPASLVRDAAVAAIEELGVGAPLNNLRILPQGRSPLPPGIAPQEAEARYAAIRRHKDAGTRVIFGAGAVQFRKGVDLFIEVARQAVHDLGGNVHFVWIGGGYDPVRDAVYSVYLRDQLAKSGLDEHVTFVSEVPDLAPLFELGDAFLLSSRLDPFPNVALDAMTMNLPVVCFEGATGIADLTSEFPSLVRAVAYQDCRAAATTLLSLSLAADPDRELQGSQFREWADFDRYAKEIVSVVEGAREKARSRAEVASRLVTDESFKPDVFLANSPPWIVNEAGGPVSTRSRAAGLAARLIQNGIDQALLDHGTLTRPVGTPGAAFQSIPLVAEQGGDHALPIVAVVESLAGVQLLASRLFASVEEEPALVILRCLPGDREGLARAIAGIPATRVYNPNVELTDQLSSGPIKLWIVEGTSADPGRIAARDRIAAQAFAADAGLEAIFLLAAHGVVEGKGNLPPTIGGLPLGLLDRCHLWLRRISDVELRRLAQADAGARRPDVLSVASRQRMADIAVLERERRLPDSGGEILGRRTVK